MSNQKTVIDIDAELRPLNYRNCRNTVTEKKPRYSKKYKCPQCQTSPLEIYGFIDWNDKYVCDVYICEQCGTFWTKEECDKI